MLRLRLVSGSGVEDETWCATKDAACLDSFFRGLEAPWPATAPRTGLSVAAAAGGGLTVLAARGPAASAGLKAGDLLESAGGLRLTTIADFEKAIRERASGPVADERRLPPGRGPAGAGRKGSPAGSDAAAHGAGEEVLLALVIRRGEGTREVMLPIERAPAVSPPGRDAIPAARLAAIAELESALVPPGESGNAALLGLASALIGRGAHEEALERALESQGLSGDPEGAVALGTARYLAGLAHLALGHREQAFAAFRRAATDPGATLWDPDGLPVAPMARLALKALGAP